jgi:hypothetical protein
LRAASAEDTSRATIKRWRGSCIAAEMAVPGVYVARLSGTASVYRVWLRLATGLSIATVVGWTTSKRTLCKPPCLKPRARAAL